MGRKLSLHGMVSELIYVRIFFMNVITSIWNSKTAAHIIIILPEYDTAEKKD